MSLDGTPPVVIELTPEELAESDHQVYLADKALNCIPLGAQRFYEWVLDVDGERVGIILYHQAANGTWCSMMTYTVADPPGELPAWTVVEEAPLTLDPELVCPECGMHGWLYQGRWLDQRLENPATEPIA